MFSATEPLWGDISHFVCEKSQAVSADRQAKVKSGPGEDKRAEAGPTPCKVAHQAMAALRPASGFAAEDMGVMRDKYH